VVWGAVGWGLGSVTSGFFNNSFAYVNPYFTTPVVATNVASSAVPYDYSQPVVVNNYITADSNSEGSTASSTASPTNTANPVANAAVQESLNDFDTGLSSFRSGDYKSALDAFNSALRKNGGDPVIHEVRALTLFALGDYASAAPALNSLLASAPGMDWTTVSSLYNKTDDYTAQLRKLEEYCKANPKNPASAFVLAYHYLVIGSKDSAIRALKVVVENQPKDVTAKRMLDALSPPESTTAPAPAADDAAASNGPEVDLVGKWLANAGNTTIELAVTEDSTFTWKATEAGKPAIQLSGDFGTNGDAIMMDTKDQGSLGGNVKAISADEWQLVPPGAKDPKAGLTFKRAK
jgi:tetratricopeptide (TPR) repeat protein